MTATTRSSAPPPSKGPTYSPGSLVRARGREWLVLAGSDTETLRVRPLAGTDDDQTRICLALEAEPVTDATFPPPDVRQRAGHEAALLLRDALVLSMRRGAGPFRAFGQIAVEPRAYQLVPLLMALKLDPVRLLIADDVGIGKTIEAGLIARELLDRGEIKSMVVLCPPHLVDQWVGELEVRFHLHPVAVTAANARRLEDSIPPGESIFAIHHHTVVSLDYIKSESRRDRFLHTCPELVIVDEAHTCAATKQGRHQRYELLRALAESPTRHMVLLTATPHSGDESAFFRLLGLLDPAFERLETADQEERKSLRNRLAAHLVQRQRPDINEWHEGELFPRRQTKELTYKLTGDWERFFTDVLAYCAGVVEAAEGDARRQRLSFWGTLALMRCVASSPAAAAQALRTRAGLAGEAEAEEALRDRVFDGAADAMPEDDVEPPVGADDPALAGLIEQAVRLAGQGGDPKLKLLVEHLSQLIAEGFNPVVFCRYLATADYLGKHLKGRFKNVTVDVVDGLLPADERRVRVDALGDAERRLLVATDCLSEGVNLQDHFNAVVHYDLSWNPTRHEQREGRVDRFGQKSRVVRATLIYGVNNPVDGAVLDVILRKAAKIREELGVAVPKPDDGHSLTEALLKAVLLKGRKKPAAGAGDAAEMKQLALFDAGWREAAETAKRNRSKFAQLSLKPDDVLPEWHKSLAALGGEDDVRRFTGRAFTRLGSGLEPLKQGFKAPLSALPDDVRERLEAEGLSDTLLIDFAYPPAPRCRPVQRSHPLVSVLAEALLERTLGAGPGDTGNDRSVLGRAGCWVSAQVTSRTTVALLRLRHQLVTPKSDRSSTLLVEEAGALAWSGASASLLEGTDAMALLAAPPAGDPPPHVRERFVAEALQQLEAKLGDIDAFARRRAEALLADHRRVREAAKAQGKYEAKAILPPDVIGLYVLLPQVG